MFSTPFYCPGQTMIVAEKVGTEVVRRGVVLEHFVKRDGMAETWQAREEIADGEGKFASDEYTFNVPNNTFNLFALHKRLTSFQEKHGEGWSEDDKKVFKEAMALVQVATRIMKNDYLPG